MTYIEKRKLLQNWLELDNFIEKDREFLKEVRPRKGEIHQHFNSLTSLYFSHLPFGNITANTHEISFFEHATDIINILFDTYVKNDTLVIVSNNEHENVIKRYKACKHVYELDFDSEILPCKLDKLFKECNKYQKIFIYVIGTQVSNGIITPQLFFTKIKNWLEQNKKEYILNIDDVHGMFIVPRDYSIFNHVIYTCHALIPDYDMGMLIAPLNSIVKGKQYWNWGLEYLQKLNKVKSSYRKFYTFKDIMMQYFEEEIISGKLTINANTAPHIFGPEIHGFNLDKKTYNDLFKELSEYGLRFEASFDEKEICNSRVYLRVREGQYFMYPERLIPGLEMVKQVLEMIE